MRQNTSEFRHQSHYSCSLCLTAYQFRSSKYDMCVHCTMYMCTSVCLPFPMRTAESLVYTQHALSFNFDVLYQSVRRNLSFTTKYVFSKYLQLPNHTDVYFRRYACATGVRNRIWAIKLETDTPTQENQNATTRAKSAVCVLNACCHINDAWVNAFHFSFVFSLLLFIWSLQDIRSVWQPSGPTQKNSAMEKKLNKKIRLSSETSMRIDKSTRPTVDCCVCFFVVVVDNNDSFVFIILFSFNFGVLLPSCDLCCCCCCCCCRRWCFVVRFSSRHSFCIFCCIAAFGSTHFNTQFRYSTITLTLRRRVAKQNGRNRRILSAQICLFIIVAKPLRYASHHFHGRHSCV